MKRKPMWRTALSTGAMLLAAATVLLGGGQSTAHAGPPADAVLDWNLYAAQTLFNGATATPPGAGQTPPVGTLHLAMVQGAVYDAVNMIDGGHEPYLDGLPDAPASASKAAAVATAAHDVLVGVNLTPPLSPAIVDRLDDLRDASIADATIADGAAAVAEGIAAGRAAATAILDEREDDGRYGTFRFTEGTGVGQWRATAGVNDPFAWVARVEPVVMESASQFRTKGPRIVGSDGYRKEYEEVKRLGGNGTTTPSQRTPEQTAIAQFFTVNPVEMYNRAFRGIAASQGLTLVEQARLFATSNIAGADALISCWDDKAHWSFWRPITAIRLGETDGDPTTVGDASWTSFIGAPPYPEHPSGYNCGTGAFMHAAKAFFGKGKLEFSLTANLGTPPVPVTRTYDRFTDVVDDTIEARICQGIHFRSSDVQGAWIGKKVARWVDKHYFEPVDEHDEDDDEEDDD